VRLVDSESDGVAASAAVASGIASPERTAALAPLGDRFADIRRIVVLRGGGIGDLLQGVPAIAALEAAYPDARITLLGSPHAADVLAGHSGAPHNIETIPIHHGVREVPGAAEDPVATEAFVERMRRQQFDLAVQLHGGGRFSNPFLLRLGARHSVGTATPDAAPLERILSYSYYQHEMLRALEVVGLAGAAPVVLEPHLEVAAAARTAVQRLVEPGAESLVVVHPGATDPRRHWPAERFAAVTGALAAAGAHVIIVGEGADRRTADEVLARVSARAGSAAARVSSLAGSLTLSQFAALAARADVFLGNDSGPRHIAAAVGTRTVSIYWFGNLINAGPLDRGRHRVHLSWTTQCPVCGRDCTQVGWTAPRCEHDVSFVADVPVEPVLADVRALLADRPGRRLVSGD
jgi:ADP-heptose:LPS heptosyltransferase